MKAFLIEAFWSAIDDFPCHSQFCHQHSQQWAKNVKRSIFLEKHWSTENFRFRCCILVLVVANFLQVKCLPKMKESGFVWAAPLFYIFCPPPQIHQTSALATRQTLVLAIKSPAAAPGLVLGKWRRSKIHCWANIGCLHYHHNGHWGDGRS